MVDLVTRWGFEPGIALKAKSVGAGVIARVICIERGRVELVTTENKTQYASVRQQLLGPPEQVGLGVGVGDWVVLDETQAWVIGIIERKTSLVRRLPGKAERPQILASNLDYVFVVTAAGLDFSVSRLERFLSLVLDGGAEPVVVINKIDAVESREELERAVERLGQVPILWLSALTGAGYEGLKEYLRPGSAVAFVGSSGVGKSTLVNRVLGEERQAVQQVREIDQKGRHTTTRRELILAENGVLLLDTPGVRELGLWLNEDGLEQGFQDVFALGTGCRFSNCSHRDEPDCALNQAVSEGRLLKSRLDSFLALLGEAEQQKQRRRGVALGNQRSFSPSRVRNKQVELDDVATESMGGRKRSARLWDKPNSRPVVKPRGNKPKAK